MRFPEQEPRCACRAEGTLRLQRQTGALHLARASPSATRTGRGIGGRGGGGGERTMTACWNAAVRCERRSSGVCRHGPPEPARGPSRSLQDSGRQPAPATLSAHGRASRPSSSLELSVKERQPHGCQEFPVGFASIADTDGLQPLGAGRQELPLARAEAATHAVRHPLISRAGPVTSLVQGQPPAWCCIRSFREQGLPPAWCRASHQLGAASAPFAGTATSLVQGNHIQPTLQATASNNDRAGQWGCRDAGKVDSTPIKA